MAKTMHCHVVSAEESLFTGDVQMVIAAGDLGDLGITPGHAPLITTLKPGPVRLVFENGSDELFFVSGGFLEVIPSQVENMRLTVPAKICADTLGRWFTTQSCSLTLR